MGGDVLMSWVPTQLMKHSNNFHPVLWLKIFWIDLGTTNMNLGIHTSVQILDLLAHWMQYEISAPQCKEHGTYVLKQHGEVHRYLESWKAPKCRAIAWYLWAHFQLDAHDDVFGYLKWNLGSWIWCYRSTRKWPKELTPAATLSMPFSIEALAPTQIMLPQLSTLQHSAQAHFCSHLLLLLQEPQEQSTSGHDLREWRSW